MIYLLFLFRFRTRNDAAALKTTIIYPATENHIVKYSTQEVFIFEESAADYIGKTLPYIEAEQFSLDVSIRGFAKRLSLGGLVFCCRRGRLASALCYTYTKDNGCLIIVQCFSLRELCEM